MKESLANLYVSPESLENHVLNLFELNYQPETFKTISDHIAQAGFKDIKVLEPKYEHWGYNFRVEAVK